MRAWLRRLHDEVHVTTLLVTHDADEAMEIADALVLMHDGRVEQSGTPLDLYDRPVSPFALHFLGPANIIASDGNLRYVRPHELRRRLARVRRFGSRRGFRASSISVRAGASTSSCRAVIRSVPKCARRTTD